MSINKLNPYIHFNGTAEKAIRLYESALGAKIENMTRYEDVPGGNTPPEHKGRVMHAVIRMGEGVVMLSDTSDKPASTESNVHIALDFREVADMAKAFDGLAAGGKVTVPIQDTFWGGKFGMLTDAYGVRWMFNCEAKKG